MVSKIEGQYRACKHPFKITLTPKTHVVEQENIYVDFPVSFLTLHDVLSLGQDVKIDHLVGEFLICKVSFILLFLYCDLKFEVKFFIHNYCY